MDSLVVDLRIALASAEFSVATDMMWILRGFGVWHKGGEQYELVRAVIQGLRAARRRHGRTGRMHLSVAVPIGTFGIRLLRSGLGEAPTDEVGPGDDGDVEPRLAGDELVAVAIPTCDHRSADENRGDDPDHGPELRRLERGLCLGGVPAQTAHAASPARRSSSCCFHHSSFVRDETFASRRG